MKKVIILIFILFLTACGGPLTDEMVKSVGETCKQQNKTLFVNSSFNIAECE
jgi:hypothetical protein